MWALRLVLGILLAPIWAPIWLMVWVALQKQMYRARGGAKPYRNEEWFQ